MNRKYSYLLMLGHFCTDINQGALPAILPFLIASQGLNYASAASVVLAANLVSSVVQPFFGFIGDRNSRPWLMSLGILLAGIGISMIGVASSYWFACLAAAISGFGIALFHPEGGKLANYVAGTKKGTGISIFAVGGNLGFAIGPLLASIVLSIWGLKGTIFFIFPTLIMSVVLLKFNSDFKDFTPKKSNSLKDESIQTVQDDWGAFSKVSSLVFCRSIIQYSLLTFIPLFFIQSFSQSESSANLNLTIFSLIGAIATIIGGRYADKYGLKRIIRIGFVALVPLLLIFLQVDNQIFASALIIPIGFAMNGLYSPLIAMGQSFVPNHIGFASGITLGLAVSVGGIFAPIIGWIGDKYGLITAMYAILSIAIIAMLLTFILPKNKEQKNLNLKYRRN